jgi:hypothetical protein
MGPLTTVSSETALGDHSSVVTPAKITDCDEGVYVGKEVLTADNMEFTVFWDVMPCSLIELNRHFGGTHCPHFRN